MDIQSLYVNYQNTVTNYDKAIQASLQSKDFQTINALEIQRNMLLNVMKDMAGLDELNREEPDIGE